jgi:D-serine deaminase-like pyridoxal phosphate-dependent protein
MNRTGVPIENEPSILEVARAAGERFRGVHFYDGHIHGEDAVERREMAFEAYDRLMGLLGRFDRDGFAVGEVITSGTPSFLYALAYEPFVGIDSTIHRVSPGTVVFHDLRSEQEIEDLDLLPAAVVLSRVVSHPAPDIVTCDAGSKSIAADAGDPCAFALGHPELEALTPSEEHLPFRVHDGARLARGSMLSLVPTHVCPTVNLADQALLVDEGRFVGVASVRARGHDLLLES